MRPGDLRFWDNNEPPDVRAFVLLERVLLNSAGGTKESGWRILEGDVVKGVYEIVIQHYSRSAEEVSK
jgi:hypothetical protein